MAKGQRLKHKRYASKMLLRGAVWKMEVIRKEDGGSGQNEDKKVPFIPIAGGVLRRTGKRHQDSTALREEGVRG